jgi:uncharacterized protein (TIRG00374 family)
LLRLSAIYLGAIILLAFSLRLAPLGKIWESLAHLAAWQVGALLLINVLVLASMTARWWLILRAEHPRLPFLPLVGYRLSAFGLSYFTFGPQVGGEPLQVIYLRRFHGLSLGRAASAVLMDKLLEFLGNFIFISLGLFAAARIGLSANLPASAWLPLLLLLLWPALHIFLLSRGLLPVSGLLRLVFSRYRKQKWFRLILISERLASSFTRRHPLVLFASLAASLLAWTGMAAEYLLMLRFLDVHLEVFQGLAGLTAAMLAFLVPIPAGLGALEASQILALGSLGYTPAVAIGLSLLLRARDILNGGLGLLLAARSFSR